MTPVACVVLLMFAVAARTAELNRWEVNTFDEMAAIIEQCYADKNVECIMGFVYTKGVPQQEVEEVRTKLSDWMEDLPLESVTCGPWSDYVARQPRHLPDQRLEGRLWVEPYISPVEDFVYISVPDDCRDSGGSVTVCYPRSLKFWLAVDRGVTYLVPERRTPLPLDDRVTDAFVMKWADGYIDYPDLILHDFKEFIPGHGDDVYESAISESIIRLHAAGLVTLCQYGHFDNRGYPSFEDCVEASALPNFLAATLPLSLSPEAENMTHDLELTPSGEEDFEETDYISILYEVDQLLDPERFRSR